MGIIDKVTEVAKTVLPFVPGGEEGLKAGRAVIDLIVEVKDAVAQRGELSDAEAQRLDQERVELERAVNAHAADVSNKLGDPI